ncbi:DUF4864 domain-containing protein [uncultured Enterovirga sp.]|uniref:DUF4864 domain-containing protein n=1 Tax=uncultured Enterovirga sp. TaxID=2026352 RepID=UPI0035CB2AD1
MAGVVAHFRILACALALAVTLGAGSLAALEDADRSAARSVIEKQIDAFRRDDAAAAFGLAAPSIQGMFPTQELFLDMVRRGYAPVYRPRSFEFGPVRESGEGIEQAVRVQDGEGVDWDAVYSLERQPDGTWRISGCRLVKRPGEAV